MTKKCGARLCIPGLVRHFFRHSAVPSLTAVLLRKVPIGAVNNTAKHLTKKQKSKFSYCDQIKFNGPVLKLEISE